MMNVVWHDEQRPYCHWRIPGFRNKGDLRRERANRPRPWCETPCTAGHVPRARSRRAPFPVRARTRSTPASDGRACAGPKAPASWPARQSRAGKLGNLAIPVVWLDRCLAKLLSVPKAARFGNRRLLGVHRIPAQSRFSITDRGLELVDNIAT